MAPIGTHTSKATAQHWGMSFEGNFFNGYEGIVARYDAPILRFPASTPLQNVRDTVDAWNTEVRAMFDGVGYYGFCPMQEIEHGPDHVLILFASEDFYDQFIGCVQSVRLPS